MTAHVAKHAQQDATRHELPPAIVRTTQATIAKEQSTSVIRQSNVGFVETEQEQMTRGRQTT